MWPCDGSSIHRYLDTAPTHRPYAGPARERVSSARESFLRLEPLPEAMMAWAAAQQGQCRFAPAATDCSCSYSTGARRNALTPDSLSLYICARAPVVEGEFRELYSKLISSADFHAAIRLLKRLDASFELEPSNFTHPSSRDDLLTSRYCLDGIRNRCGPARGKQHFAASRNPQPLR